MTKLILLLFTSVTIVAASVRFVWRDDNPPEKLRAIHWHVSVDGTNYTLLAHMTNTTLRTYTFERVPPGVYWFRISAVSTNGIASGPSNVLKVEVPSDPALTEAEVR